MKDTFMERMKAIYDNVCDYPNDEMRLDNEDFVKLIKLVGQLQKQNLLLGQQRLMAVASLAFCAEQGGMTAGACDELIKQIQALEGKAK